MCSPERASIIVQLHVLTGSDSTSGFFGRGKNAVVKNVLKNIEDAKLLLDDLGKSLTMPEAVYKKIILLVLRYVYNDKKSLNIAESRSLVWRRIKKKSTQRLPPDEDTLRGYIQRCNYVIFTNLHYNSPCAIESLSYHGWISQNGVYVPRRYQKPEMSVLPLKKITYDQQFKEEKDETIIQEHDIISKSDIENIYTDEELSADDYAN